MIIPIDDDHRISSNKYSWDLEKRGTFDKRRGRQKWVKLGHYTTFGQALSGAAQREIRLSKAEGLVEAEEAVRRVTIKYAAIFDEVEFK